MHKLALYTCLMLVFTSSTSRAANDSAPRTPFNQVVDFVEKHLAGKTLEAKTTSKVNGEQLETEFHRKTMYTNVIRTKDTATFDAIILIQQRLWALDSEGKRKSESPTLKDRALLIRYGVHASKSTGEAVGTSEILTNSLSPTVGMGSAIQMRVSDSKLILVATTPTYSDGFATVDSYKPIASQDTVTFSVLDGKLVAETVELSFDVDPGRLPTTNGIG